MKNHTCCFTGHRDLSGVDTNRLGNKVRNAILKCLELGIYQFENGAALGFDTFAAAWVIRMRQFHPEIRLRLMIPCRDQCKNWSSYDLLVYRNIIRHADEVVYLSDTYYDGCMKARNYRMVEDSTACICYYDGRGRSGTAQTVAYAKRKGLLIFNCKDDPESNTNRSYFDI